MQIRLATTLAKKQNWLYLLSGAGDRATTVLRPVAYAGGANADTLHVHIQQKRRYATARGSEVLEEVSCAGLDGAPWADEKEKEDGNTCPLSEATDGAEDFGGGPVLRFGPEQVDTAEEALLRASRIWKERVTRGDPDFPPSKVLRALRGENF